MRIWFAISSTCSRPALRPRRSHNGVTVTACNNDRRASPAASRPPLPGHEVIEEHRHDAGMSSTRYESGNIIWSAIIVVDDISPPERPSTRRPVTSALGLSPESASSGILFVSPAGQVPTAPATSTVEALPLSTHYLLIAFLKRLNVRHARAASSPASYQPVRAHTDWSDAWLNIFFDAGLDAAWDAFWEHASTIGDTPELIDDFSLYRRTKMPLPGFITPIAEYTHYALALFEIILLLLNALKSAWWPHRPTIFHHRCRHTQAAPMFRISIHYATTFVLTITVNTYNSE